MKRVFERMYKNKYDNSLILGSIDLRKGVVYLQDGQEFTTEEVLEHYKVHVHNEVKSKKYKIVSTFKYDPVCGEKRYFEKKVRI